MTKLLAVFVVAAMALPIGRVDSNPHWTAFGVGNPAQPVEVAPDAYQINAYQIWGGIGAVEAVPDAYQIWGGVVEAAPQ